MHDNTELRKRRLRSSNKSKRKRYEETAEDEIRQHFHLEEHLGEDRYTAQLVIDDLPGRDFDMDYVEANGLERPLLFKNADGLGITIPERLGVRDVLEMVDREENIKVQNSRDQSAMGIKLEKFVEHYSKKNGENREIWNMLSFEFSHYERFSRLVESPKIVRQLDWIETIDELPEKRRWRSLKGDKHWYPKVQKYCLMSERGSYTKFHIDMGGTSVWYHVKKGKKIFWVVEPTPENLGMYERYEKRYDENNPTFFGELVRECQRVELCAGNTFIIPSGWIHAVYTPEDSLVFGGNFLHSFSVEMQDQVCRLETKTKTDKNAKVPQLRLCQWYALKSLSKRIVKSEPLCQRELEGMKKLFQIIGGYKAELDKSLEGELPKTKLEAWYEEARYCLGGMNARVVVRRMLDLSPGSKYKV